jgi:hypothetical protein
MEALARHAENMIDVKQSCSRHAHFFCEQKEAKSFCNLDPVGETTWRQVNRNFLVLPCPDDGAAKVRHLNPAVQKRFKKELLVFTCLLLSIFRNPYDRR